MKSSPIAEQIKALPAGGITLNIEGMAKPPWDYQSHDIAWMLAQKQGIIGSEVGTGKTVLAIGAAQYLKNKLGRHWSKGNDWRGMVVLMPKMAGVLPAQWASELRDFAPGLHVVWAQGDKRERWAAYQEPWDVLLLNYESARNDAAGLKHLFESHPPTLLFCDEATAFRSVSSKTARMVRAITPFFEYRFAVTGTPIQTNLEDLHGICASMGWGDLVGTKAWFVREYCIQNRVEFYVGGMKRSKLVTVGYKKMDELRARVEPWFIRRQLDEPEVAKRVPVVVPFVFRMEMTRAQQVLYNQTQRGMLTEVRNGQIETTYVDALRKYGHLAAIADGTKTFNHELEDRSVKSDWLMAALQGSMADEKVLVFSRFVRSIRPLEERMDKAGIGYGLFLGGSHQTHEERMGDIERFRHDPECRVLMATQAVEMGLNLQVARVVVFYGFLPNPKRMEQILGRIRRAGSPYANVAAITLLAADTVEEGVYDTVLERNAIGDVFWEEESVLFEKLGPDRLMQLIRDYTP